MAINSARVEAREIAREDFDEFRARQEGYVDGHRQGLADAIEAVKNIQPAGLCIDHAVVALRDFKNQILNILSEGM